MYELSVFGRGILTYTAQTPAEAARKTRQLLKSNYCVAIETNPRQGKDGLIVTRTGTRRRKGTQDRMTGIL